MSSNSYVTNSLTSKSGLPVCRYALGGAARSNQPKNLVQSYYDDVVSLENINGNDTPTPAKSVSPFYFYYNPHRYPDFMDGIRELVNRDDDNYSNNAIERRENIFLG